MQHALIDLFRTIKILPSCLFALVIRQIKPKQTGKTDGRSIEKQWNPYCTCELWKCPGIKKSETGIHIINLSK